MKINYRPEIDGLRAISVVAVIIYHSQSLIFPEEFLSGGFIGVDIFFVISGYLISSIIFKELKITKKFSFANFYERRSRRILPALFSVLLFSIPLAYIFLPPKSILLFCESIASSIFFISNIYFHFQSINYNSVDSLYIPFLHTWSLSVEEQFYILFPISILIIYKIFKNHILFFLLLGFFISFIFSIWLSYNHPVFNFYMLPSRGWELLSGSILGYIEINFGRKVETNKLNFLFPKIGFFLIIGSFFYFNDTTIHPSILTFFPILGVALLIWFANKKELITKILSYKHLVFVGLISYSLYLWHYPILAFLRNTQIDTNHILIKITFILIIFIISLISYSLIEKPCRDKKNNSI